MTDDRISIEALKVPTHIGVTEEEREKAQTIVVDLEITVDLAVAGKSGELSDTVDYDRLATDIAALVRSSRLRLLEELAESIAAEVCSLPRVDRVTVAVSKQSPPVAEEVGPISVRITRP